MNLETKIYLTKCKFDKKFKCSKQVLKFFFIRNNVSTREQGVWSYNLRKVVRVLIFMRHKSVGLRRTEISTLTVILYQSPDTNQETFGAGKGRNLPLCQISDINSVNLHELQVTNENIFKWVMAMLNHLCLFSLLNRIAWNWYIIVITITLILLLTTIWSYRNLAYKCCCKEMFPLC